MKGIILDDEFVAKAQREMDAEKDKFYAIYNMMTIVDVNYDWILHACGENGKMHYLMQVISKTGEPLGEAKAPTPYGVWGFGKDRLLVKKANENKEVA